MPTCACGGCLSGLFTKPGSLPPAKSKRRRGQISIHRQAGNTSLLEGGRWVYRLVCTEDVTKVYVLQKQIGEGAFGKVYVAQHKELGYHRAVKKIKKSKTDLSKNEDAINEVYTLMNLTHPYIIKLSRMYDDGSNLYIVSELCNGPSLLKRIEDRPMSEQERGIALRHILKAVQCCHAHYMGHYDIKPDNFMYVEADCMHLKMIDLGLSSSFMRATSEFKGTPDYTAPEIWKGVFGPEADIWSCGVVLYTMITRNCMVPPKIEDHKINALVHNQKWVKGRIQKAKSSGASDLCISLLQDMLRIDRHLRKNAGDAIEGDYIQWTYQTTPMPSDLMEKALPVIRTMVPMFKSFGSEKVLVRGALLVMVHIVGYNASETRAHRNAYGILDRKGVGEISVEAIEAAMPRHGLEVPDDLHEAFSAVDLNQDGYITFGDFLAATLPRSLRCREDLCRRVFTLMDLNHDGYIDSKDLINTFLARNERNDSLYLGLVSKAMDEAADDCAIPRLNFDAFLELVLSGRQAIHTSSSGGFAEAAIPDAFC